MIACKTCKAAVLYARNVTTGRMMILDAAPDQQAGTVVVDPSGPEPRCQVLDQEMRQMARDEGAALYVTHFATCPDARQHRRRRR